MSQIFYVHPDNPQERLIGQISSIVHAGGIIAYPTDSAYALGCKLGDKRALDRIRKLRRLDDKHHFTLMCRDLSDIGNYGQVDNQAYRLLKSMTPGPFTFILRATKEVPRRLMHVKRRTIGIRIPDNSVARAILAAVGEPLLTTTLILPGEEYPISESYMIDELVGDHIEAVVDAGNCGIDVTTVIDLESDQPSLVRQGKGDASKYIHL